MWHDSGALVTVWTRMREGWRQAMKGQDKRENGLETQQIKAVHHHTHSPARLKDYFNFLWDTWKIDKAPQVPQSHTKMLSNASPKLNLIETQIPAAHRQTKINMRVCRTKLLTCVWLSMCNITWLYFNAVWSLWQILSPMEGVNPVVSLEDWREKKGHWYI